MPALSGDGRTVCVTGAGGFIASWLVKRLLEKGYTVRGTVRNPGLVRLVRNGVWNGPFQPDYITQACFEEKMIEPAIHGTQYVITAAADAGVKRVVFTSSIGTVYMNPYRDPIKPVDDTCWSDLDYCKQTENWYCYAKTVAEQGAWEVARKRGVDLVVVNPVLVLGPLLQQTVNASTDHVMKYLTGSARTYVNAAQAYVHVKDVAEAHVRVYETPGAHGRYICAESTLHRGELCRILSKLFPEYPIPTKCKDEVNPPVKGYKFSNQRLKDLGMEFVPVLQCLYETVKSLQDKGMLPVLPPNDQDELMMTL
ncbi:hypothetical protein PR202_ga29887 [Eleusine coracana subsp. coracana]|uniref:NAD-dependent epimerase/dehydratase domain-containing protein n=1 Tax=Eleusine coracana subsp. coracana TaxID=191504 RepID=A0AAV5DN24_ELECO|nr:hypothetical protein PR202_ga29887 [Eleusine coracana subsp. coracana]